MNVFPDEMEQDAEVPAHRLLLESIVGSLPLSKGLDDTVARFNTQPHPAHKNTLIILSLTVPIT